MAKGLVQMVFVGMVLRLFHGSLLVGVVILPGTNLAAAVTAFVVLRK